MAYYPNNRNQRSFQSRQSPNMEIFSESDARTEFSKMSKDFGEYANQKLIEVKSAGHGSITMKTNQIRNVLAMISSLWNRELGKTGELNEETLSELKYIKIKLAYAIGRDDGKLGIKAFNEKTHMYEFIGLVKSRQDFTLYCRYLEALVAYHKYYGGKN